MLRAILFLSSFRALPRQPLPPELALPPGVPGLRVFALDVVTRLCTPFTIASVTAHSARVPSPFHQTVSSLKDGLVCSFTLHPGGPHGSGTLHSSEMTLFKEGTITVWGQGVVRFGRREAIGSHGGL